MRFRPCIDIHNGSVKQIVGSSLAGEKAEENFVSEKGAAYYASLYKEYALTGGHVILLNKAGTKEYEATRAEAVAALRAYPGGLMVGGGITPENASEFLQAGASAVIVTSYVFSGGKVDRERLLEMEKAAGRERLVLDLSCRRVKDSYFVATDRWQNITSEEVGEPLLTELAEHACEFLVHGVDVEGKRSGIEEDLVRLLGQYSPIPVTYAGGVQNEEDLIKIKEVGSNKVDVTIGSALDIFGGALPFERIARKYGAEK